MIICNHELQPGEKKRCKLAVNERIQIPLWLVAGEEPGPTLIITAGVHGCEYVGVLTVKKCLRSLIQLVCEGKLLFCLR